ncbi:MAG: hypothetical protein HC828_08140 [Blastochloris sp.]|nr:hypothetical protein [Blastochloris sp.]
MQQAIEHPAPKRAAQERDTYDIDFPVSPSEIVAPVSSSKVPLLDRNVIVLARAIQQHKQHGFEKTLGHVKAEKILHIVEAHSTINLGRSPARLAAGPADFDHLLSVLAYGKKLGAFQDVKRSGYAYPLCQDH